MRPHKKCQFPTFKQTFFWKFLTLAPHQLIFAKPKKFSINFGFTFQGAQTTWGPHTQVVKVRLEANSSRTKKVAQQREISFVEKLLFKIMGKKEFLKNTKKNQTRTRPEPEQNQNRFKTGSKRNQRGYSWEPKRDQKFGTIYTTRPQ